MLMLPLLIYLTTLGTFQVHALEEPSPEVFLQPRNFNPHPYELGYDPTTGDRQVSRLREYANQIEVFTGHNRGPVLFPLNRGIGGGGENRVTSDPYAVAKLKDTHPYAGVAAKKKKKYGLGLGRFASEPEHHSPQVYKALAAHGAKVLKVPQAKDLKNVPNLVEHYDYDDETKKNYAFSYKVVDHLTGDDFSHRQTQNSHATNGEYRVKLPDGRVQIVSYTADKNGYKADVKYSGNEHTAPHPQHHHQTLSHSQEYEHNQHQPVVYAQPARHRFAARPPPSQPTHQHLSPVQPTHVPLYADSLLHNDAAEHGGRVVLKSHAHDFINQRLITNEQVRPSYYDEQHTSHGINDDDRSLLFILPNKYREHSGSTSEVQLLPNIHEQKVHHQRGKFITATLAPYIVANGQAQTLSTLAPDLDKFNPVYIDAPKYKLPTTIQH